MHDHGVIRTHYTSKRTAAGPGFRPCGHWEELEEENEVGNDRVGKTNQDNGDYLTSPKQ
jgi:hypothetical protein